jgi:hypothetical protein
MSVVPGSKYEYTSNSRVLAVLERSSAVIVPFESPTSPLIGRLIDLLAADMERVNATIRSRIESEVTMIPAVANHLIESGGKRLRPMLTLAMSRLVTSARSSPGRFNTIRYDGVSLTRQHEG